MLITTISITVLMTMAYLTGYKASELLSNRRLARAAMNGRAIEYRGVMYVIRLDTPDAE